MIHSKYMSQYYVIPSHLFGDLVTLEMTDDSASCSELDLVLSRLGWQGHLVEVIKVGVAHGSLCRDSLGWVVHLARSYSKGVCETLQPMRYKYYGYV